MERWLGIGCVSGQRGNLKVDIGVSGLVVLGSFLGGGWGGLDGMFLLKGFLLSRALCFVFPGGQLC